jgi:hypothetical protein
MRRFSKSSHEDNLKAAPTIAVGSLVTIRAITNCEFIPEGYRKKDGTFFDEFVTLTLVTDNNIEFRHDVNFPSMKGKTQTRWFSDVNGKRIETEDEKQQRCESTCSKSERRFAQFVEAAYDGGPDALFKSDDVLYSTMCERIKETSCRPFQVYITSYNSSKRIHNIYVGTEGVSETMVQGWIDGDAKKGANPSPSPQPSVDVEKTEFDPEAL